MHFCFAKGDPLRVRTFTMGNGCLLLQLRKSTRGRFIVFSRFAHSRKSRTIIFPWGPYADGWFGVTKLLKKMLISGYIKGRTLPCVTTTSMRSSVNRRSSYSNVVRDDFNGARSNQLMVWRC